MENIMLIHYRDGRALQGILLSLKGDEMRVAVKDEDDVVEFRLVNGVWISEGGELVTFEFPTAIFQAVGIVPDGHTFDSQPDFFWDRETSAASGVDPAN